MRLFQSDSYIAVDFLNPGVRIHKLKGDPRGVSDLSQVVDIIEPKVDQVEQLKAELGAFADCIINDTIPLVTGRDGLLALQVAEEIMGEIEKRNQRLKGKT
ncbi:MAG: hypothetical protein Q7U87_02465, partial [bacterium]|nr:hypothetical protein [bacterium]